MQLWPETPRARFKRVIINAVNLQTRVCKAELKGELGEGSQGTVFLVGPHTAVKRYWNDCRVLSTEDESLSLEHVDHLNRIQRQFGPVCAAEFAAILVGERGLGPLVYRVASCPAANDDKVLFMDRWDGTLLDDINRMPQQTVFDWTNHPLRMLVQITRLILNMTLLGIHHRDLLWQNLMWRMHPVSQSLEIGIIDFGRAQLWKARYVQYTRDVRIPAFERLFSEWEQNGLLNRPLDAATADIISPYRFMFNSDDDLIPTFTIFMSLFNRLSEILRLSIRKRKTSVHISPIVDQ